MLVITVCHYVKPGQVEAARARIAANGEMMSRQPGFLFRHTGNPPDRPAEIITVTGWRNAADRDAWNTAKAQVTYPPDQSDPYERFEQYEAEVFDARWGEGFVAPA